jgi:hypothetical protein
MTSLSPDGGGPSRHQCAGCGEPIWHVQGAWRNALTDFDVCPITDRSRTDTERQED